MFRLAQNNQELPSKGNFDLALSFRSSTEKLSSPSPPPLILRRLAQLAAHLVVALIALFVIGGSTRVMEAGLACPDWPLCFGSFLPGRQMNLQVFLEWFHRLDAFLVGIVVLIQFILSVFYRRQLPIWLPSAYAFVLFLVICQGALGALTVINLLPSTIVTSHLAIGLTLVGIMSVIAKRLFSTCSLVTPLWWRLIGGFALGSVLAQCLIGGRMSTSWAAQRCLSQGLACNWLDLHRNFAIAASLLVFAFVGSSFFSRGLPRAQWHFLTSITGLIVIQIFLGIMTIQSSLSQPFLIVSHQLAAVLLVALLSALIFGSPQSSIKQFSSSSEDPLLEPCHG